MVGNSMHINPKICNPAVTQHYLKTASIGNNFIKEKWAELHPEKKFNQPGSGPHPTYGEKKASKASKGWVEP